jgi:dTDP-4-dehydrorhamnose 3,5-epimerase
MKVTPSSIPDCLIIEPQVFGDDRGYFFESWNKERFHTNGLDMEFVQDNQSMSMKGVLRGLHFQAPPFGQGKLVRVIQGSVLDVAVDIRKGSPYYGQFVLIELSGDNKRMFWIPEGFAHGFVTLEDNTIFSYRCTEVYNQASEGSIRWNDPELNIDWGIDDPVLSEKDGAAPLFESFNSPFE